MEAASAPSGAPQAPSSNGASNSNGAAGTQTPAKAPPPATVVRPNPVPKTGAPQNTAKDHALGRGRDGKFLSKNGEPAPEGSEEAKPPEYRFKRKLKVDGAETEVDYGEEDLTRELQLAHTARKRLAAIAQRQKELDVREARLKSAPHEFLAEAGHDPDKWATERLAQKAAEGLMSPEEREFRTLQSEHQKLKAELENRTKADEEREFTAHQDKMWESEQPRYLEAIAKANLPRSPEVMDLMAQVGKEFLAAKIELTPEQVVSETNDRLSGLATHYLLGLEPSALIAKLGPERVEAISREYIRIFRESQRKFADPPPTGRTASAPQAAPNGKREYINSAELERRSREMFQKLK